jgi:glycosyltransferase domain-containing protein
MTPLLIPTRNRPTSLSNVLRYLARFYGSTRVIIADGSDEAYKVRNRQEIEANKGSLTVDYRSYPPECSYLDRLLEVLKGESSDFVAVGADDDYPIMETLAKGEEFLREHGDYSIALGMLVNLQLNSPTELIAYAFYARHIRADAPHLRASQYAHWSFPTTYSVGRRDVLIKRYERARELFMVLLYDQACGFQDSMHGKIMALPEIGFICTRNYTHSYLRPEAGLIYLRRSQEVLGTMDLFRQDLVRYAGLHEEEAGRRSEEIIKSLLRESLGRPLVQTIGFERKPIFANDSIQKQIDIFEALFEKDTAVRKRYAERLAFILAAMKASAESSDNVGEKKNYETLDEQTSAQVALSHSQQE